MSQFQKEKLLVNALLADMDKADANTIGDVIRNYVDSDYTLFGCYPFNQIDDADTAIEKVWEPLFKSFNHIQRRQDIFMSGESEHSGGTWVMSMGHFMGLFDSDWIGLRATGKTTMLRYAEFFCVEGDKITKSAFFVDLIGFMHQIGLNPLPLQTGANFLCPGPRTNDGILMEDYPPAEAEHTLKVVNLMIDDLTELNKTANDNCGPELLAKSWHENMAWFGPAGIGSMHTIERYQRHHQYPFRQGLKDKVFNGHICRFAEGNYACFFGWPNLTNTAKGGFLGLPGGQKADMRVVDVYRRDGDKLAENWVIIDLPYWLKQQGLDILERTATISNPPTVN